MPVPEDAVPVPLSTDAVYSFHSLYTYLHSSRRPVIVKWDMPWLQSSSNSALAQDVVLKVPPGSRTAAERMLPHTSQKPYSIYYGCCIMAVAIGGQWCISLSLVWIATQ